MTDSIETFRWEQLARRQKIYIVGAAVLLIALIGYGIYDRIRLGAEVRVHERQAALERAAKEEALKMAAKVAGEIRIREEELAKQEVKRDEKAKEVERSRGTADNARTEYERAVRERRPDTPSTEQLCRELAELGYPCR